MSPVSGSCLCSCMDCEVDLKWVSRTWWVPHSNGVPVQTTVGMPSEAGFSFSSGTCVTRNWVTSLTIQSTVFCCCMDPEVVLKWVSHAYGTLVTLVDGVPVRTTVGTHLEVGCVTQDLLIDWVCNVPCFWACRHHVCAVAWIARWTSSG